MSKRLLQLIINTIDEYSLDAKPGTVEGDHYILACEDIIEMLEEEMKTYSEAEPGNLDPHDDPDITADAVLRGYDFCIGSDGRLYALISGDMGWCSTHIVFEPSTGVVHEEFIKKIIIAEEGDQPTEKE